jgi:hypothetical protein
LEKETAGILKIKIAGQQEAEQISVKNPGRAVADDASAAGL